MRDAFTQLQHAALGAAASPNNARAEPTRAQAISGNYAKGRITLHGLPLVIENPMNSVRTGTGQDGTQWQNRMQAHYGEISGTVGADGDPVDVFIGHFPELQDAWVINQGDARGGFDEHKLMLGFATEQQARDAYLGSFDRNWTGLLSMVKTNINSLKWWLKHGSKSRMFSLDQLPFDGSPAMNQTQWTADAQPVTPMHQLMYGLRVSDTDNLLLDSVSMADVMADPDVEAVPVLDALVVPVHRMTVFMDVLQRAMNAAGVSVTATDYTVGDPVKLRGVMQVPVLFALSDGQAITIWFHNPDTTPAKLTPLDDLISWKWMLNKKDITIVVAPEKGKDLNPREVARRVMRLADKNSAKFQQANANASARAESDAALDTEIAGLQSELSGLQHKIAVAQQTNIDREAATQRALRETFARMDKLLASIDAAKANSQKIDVYGTGLSLEQLLNQYDEEADHARSLRGEDAEGMTSWAQWLVLHPAQPAEETEAEKVAKAQAALNDRFPAISAALQVEGLTARISEGFFERGEVRVWIKQGVPSIQSQLNLLKAYFIYSVKSVDTVAVDIEDDVAVPVETTVQRIMEAVNAATPAAAVDGGAATTEEPAAEQAEPVAEIPATVKDSIRFHVAKLQDIAASLDNVVAARGNGHILSLELAEKQADIDGSQAKLAEIRGFAEAKGLTGIFDAYVAELGGVPDFAAYASTQNEAEVPADKIDWAQADLVEDFTPFGTVTINDVGAENVYFVSDGKPYYTKLLNTDDYAPGQVVDLSAFAPVREDSPAVQEFLDAGYTRVQSNDYASPEMPGEDGKAYRFNIRAIEDGFRVTMTVSMPGITGASKEVGTAADAAAALAMAAQEYESRAPAAAETQEPEVTAAAEVEPNVHAQYITIAADSIADLRKTDVDRVIGAVASDNIDGVTHESLGAWISEQRPDLADEVADVLAELSAPVAEVTAPAGESAELVADRAYLQSVIDGGVDLLSEEVFTRMEPMFAAYPEGSGLYALLEQATQVYSNAAIAEAQKALAAA